MKSLASADIPEIKIDQSAESVQELCTITARNRSWVQDFATKQVKSGRWEKVYKRIEGRIVPAYRRVK